MEISGGIEESSYGLVRGTVRWEDGREDSVRLELHLNGTPVTRLETGSTHFELDAGKVISPFDSVAVLVFDIAGRQLARFEWGEIGRPLPAAWSAESGCRYPSFFVLGAAKSGTTSLHLQLDQHPEIFMSKPKEPFFFEAEFERGPQFYYKYFGGWKGETAVGESRHRNLYLPFVPARIHSYNPRAKLIVVLRNPAERAVSHWWHWRSRGSESLSPWEACEADLARIDAGIKLESPEEIAGYAHDLRRNLRTDHRTYLDSGYYFEQLQRYMRLFERRQLHVILFDRYVTSPAETLRELFQFLEVNESIAPLVDVRPFNQSPPGMWEHVDDRLWNKLIEHYAPHNRRLEEFLGCSLASWDNASRPRR
jgi:sulfotransferase family protein